MKVKVVTLENKAAGELELNDAVFGLTPRKDILQRVVEWQRAKARAGTHKTKDRSEVSGPGKKPFKQKGSGNARQGTLRAPHHEGGGRAHGPVVRSHGYSLPKKIRALGLKHALSAKQAEGKLFIVDAFKAEKSKSVVSGMEALSLTKPLFVAPDFEEGFVRSVRNVKFANVLKTAGANVYDILRAKELVLTKEAVNALEERLK